MQNMLLGVDRLQFEHNILVINVEYSANDGCLE